MVSSKWYMLKMKGKISLLKVNYQDRTIQRKIQILVAVKATITLLDITCQSDYILCTRTRIVDYNLPESYMYYIIIQGGHLSLLTYLRTKTDISKYTSHSVINLVQLKLQHLIFICLLKVWITRIPFVSAKPFSHDSARRSCLLYIQGQHTEWNTGL